MKAWKIAMLVGIALPAIILDSRARASFTYPFDGGKIEGAFYCVAVQLNTLQCAPLDAGLPSPPNGGTSGAGQPTQTDAGTTVVISPTGTVIFSGQMDGGAFWCTISHLNELQCAPAGGTSNQGTPDE